MRYYPEYTPQPFTGRPLTMVEAGAMDTRYSSGTSRHYQVPFRKRYGRQLGSSEVDVADEKAENGWAANELAVLTEMDDVQGNGIFDPPGSHPNIHPDAGIMAARFNLPGYHARELPFARNNEVSDLATGRPIIAVPSGAVSLDTAAQITFIEQGMYRQPQAVVDLNSARPMRSKSIANVVQNPEPIGDASAAATPSAGKTLALVAATGVAVGVIYAIMKGKKKR